MFQATRRRLALWYTAVTAVLLLVFATGMYLYVRSTLIERIDDTLKHVLEVVDRSLVIQSMPPTEGRYRVDVEASFRNRVVAVEDDHIDLEWFSPTGELLWSTFSDPPNIPLHPNRSGETVSQSPEHLLRQVTERIEMGRYVLGYLRASHPWFEVTKPIRQLVLDLTLGTSLMVLGVAAIGWLLSGIAIKPVRDSYQSLKQFTADASHELRNPIATIQTNVQMALAYPDAEPQHQQRQLRVVERLTKRLGHLVNDLLFLTRSDSGMLQTNQQEVPLDALLIEVIEEQRTVAEQRGIFLCLRILEPDSAEARAEAPPEEELFTLTGDWDQLARLFTNLIGNALEHTAVQPETSEGEMPSLLSEHQKALVEVELQWAKRDRSRQLQVTVRDTGTGIPEAELPSIFDRFYRGDPSRSHSQESISTGSGLGLAIARAIVENHGGHITVSSVLQQGTTFTVTLPVVNSGPGVRAEARRKS
ncbi:MAG: sensor histidine kinase [Cyanophyceae cyanobacterium]